MKEAGKTASGILQKDHPILREKTREVAVEEIKSRKIDTVIRRMQKALESEEDGVAIAAPQIGENLRIFVVSKRVFDIYKEGDPSLSKKAKDLVFINPEIISKSKKQIVMEEGCLSVRWLYGKVKRAKKVRVKALDQEGRPFTYGGSGLLAQVFQHEMDHLEGILFTDKAKDLKEIPPNLSP